MGHPLCPCHFTLGWTLEALVSVSPTAKLSPKAVFELLKDKWDDLTEVRSFALYCPKPSVLWCKRPFDGISIQERHIPVDRVGSRMGQQTQKKGSHLTRVGTGGPDSVSCHLSSVSRQAGVIDIHLGKEGPPEVNEDRFSLPLIITIVCMASFLLLVAALYGCCHQRISQRKDQVGIFLL